MPKIPTQEQRVMEAVLAQWKEFEEPSAWKRSRKGNLWRPYDGMTVTVFLRADRYWGWCIADGDEMRYSTSGYQKVEDAKTALGEAIGIGY